MPYTYNLNELAVEIHFENAKWWQSPITGEPILRNKGEMICLMHSEISEAMEGVRKGLMDDKLPRRIMEEVELADTAIRVLDYAAGHGYDIMTSYDSFRSGGGEIMFGSNKADGLCKIHLAISALYVAEQPFAAAQDRVPMLLASVVAHLVDYSMRHSLDIWGAVAEKREYNLTRKDHTHEARMAPGGKAF